MAPSWFLATVALLALMATIVWARASMFRLRFLRRIDLTPSDPEVRVLARAALVRDAHATLLYAVLVLSCGVATFTRSERAWYLLSLVAVPVALTLARRATPAAMHGWPSSGSISSSAPRRP